MKYIATVYSHFAAIKLKKILENNNILVKLAPVPRSLSSSCGTCVFYSENIDLNIELIKNIDIDSIFEIVNENEYKLIYKKGS